MSESTWSPQTDVACALCGCVCDDLIVQVEEERIVLLDGACPRARVRVDRLNAAAPPAATVRGVAASLEQALTAAATMLQNSTAPLIYGLSESSTPGQRAAVRLADRLQATIDSTASRNQAPSLLATQRVGLSTCTLGEIRQRSDLILCWGTDPAASHPRFLDRLLAEPVSRFLPNGRADRTLIVIDEQPTATSAISDRFLQVSPERQFEMIWALRQLLRDPQAPLTGDCGLPVETLQQLAETLSACRYGSVFYGLGDASQPSGQLVVEALLQLVTDLNARTRFVARRLSLPGTPIGADNVLAWQTGFPFAVNFGRGFPRYGPGEFTANELLERQEVDCVLLVGSQSTAGLSLAARETLKGLPTICLDPPDASATFTPDVRITTSVYGVHAPGTAYRFDDVAIPLRQLCNSPYPTDETVLNRICELYEPADT